MSESRPQLLGCLGALHLTSCHSVLGIMLISALPPPETFTFNLLCFLFHLEKIGIHHSPVKSSVCLTAPASVHSQWKSFPIGSLLCSCHSCSFLCWALFKQSSWMLLPSLLAVMSSTYLHSFFSHFIQVIVFPPQSVVRISTQGRLFLSCFPLVA